MHTPFKTLVVFELRSQLRGFRFLVSTMLLSGLVAFVVWLGHTNFQMDLDVHRADVENHDQGLRSISLYSFLTPTLFKPPNPLAIFERGVEGRQGREVKISVFEVPSKATALNRGNPYLEDLAGLDVTTVVKLVLGLGALLLTFDSMVGSRSRRQLEILAAHGLTVHQVLVIKIVAVIGALAVALGAALGPPTLLLLYWGELPLTLEHVGRLVGLFLVYGSYGLAMALLGFWISLKSSSVARSLVYATSAWLVLVVLLPLVSSSLFTAFADSRADPAKLNRELAEADEEMEEKLLAFRRLDSVRMMPSGHFGVRRRWEGMKIAQRLGSAKFNDSMAEYFGYTVTVGRRYAEKKFWLESRAQAELETMIRPLSWLTALSPGLMLDLAAANLAGTSPTHHEEFMETARQYRLELMSFLELEGAVGSWRWFTDDPAGGLPWTSFIGLEPEEVGPDNFRDEAKRFQEPAVQAAVDRVIEERKSPAFRLDLTGLPSTAVSATGGAVRSLVSVLTSVLLVGILWMLVMDAVGQASVLGPADGRAQEKASRFGSWRRRRSWRPTLLGSELHHVTSQFRWRASAFLVVLTMVVGAVAFVARAEVLEADRKNEAAQVDDGLQGQNLSRFVREPYPLVRPMWNLGFVVDGYERVQPSTYKLILDSWSLSRLESSALDQLRLASTAVPDWGFVLRIILSLFACFLGYDAFCGPQLERCRWQIAAGQPLYSVVFSRVGAQWTALAAPFLFGCLLGSVLLYLSGAPALSFDEWLRLLAFFILGLTALFLFVVLALLVSAMLGRADKALVTLVLLWVSFVAVIPSAAGILALRLEPVPSAWELRASQAQVRARTKANEGAAGFRARSVAELDNFAHERRAYEIQVKSWSEETQLQREYVDAQLAQAEYAEKLASLSPVGLISSLLDRVLVSGVHRQRHFVGQALQFEDDLRDWAKRVDLKDPESPGFYFFPKFLSLRPIDPDDIPRFELREPTTADGLRSAVWPLSIFLALILTSTSALPLIFQYRLASEKS